MKGLKTNKNLKTINIKDNNFQQKGSIEIIDMLNFNKTLTKIFIQKNGIKEDLRDKILEKVERNLNWKTNKEITSIRKEAKKLKK